MPSTATARSTTSAICSRPGSTSPLLDLLNVRYLLVPADAPERPDLAPLVAELPTVYADEHVRILENPEALPRAWLVHEARAGGARRGPRPCWPTAPSIPAAAALLETAPPALSAPADPAAEAARRPSHEPDRLELRVTAQAPALLVLSEVWDPGWRDGQWRARPGAAGRPRACGRCPSRRETTVVLSYDPPVLRLGMAITLVTVLAISLSGQACVRERRARDTPEPPMSSRRDLTRLIALGRRRSSSVYRLRWSP